MDLIGIRWAALGLAVALGAAGLWLGVNHLREADSTALMVCMESERPALAWACRQGLFRFHPRPDEIPALNSASTALHAASLPNRQEARKVLAHLTSHGVDINASSNRFNVQGITGWTALHAAAFDGDAAVTCLLLEFGARPAGRTSGGRTPADVALAQREKFGDARGYGDVARILAAAEAGRTTSCPR